jgi:hypothetical protein
LRVAPVAELGVSSVSEIVKVQIREPDQRTGLAPDLPEIRPAQPPALGTDEDHSPLAGLREPFQVPAKLWHQLGGKRNGALTGPRLRRLWQ